MAEIGFGEFRLDPAERRLSRGSERIELSGRYLDALVLLVREHGRLVTKEHFHDEVWRGVPVTDEALTQCIRSLRRALSDRAEAPRFIETVPKHGYRFIAPLVGPEPNGGASAKAEPRHDHLGWLFGAGLIGAGLAGMAGGLVYGLVGTPDGGGQMGAASVLLALLCICILTALLGGAGVVGGVLAAERLAGRRSGWVIAGGAMGGMAVGAVTKLLGIDAFNLLLGRAPAGVTGGVEGLLVGAGVGLAAFAAAAMPVATPSLRRSAGFGLVSGGIAGLTLGLSGRGLMAGSLDALARTVPGSRLRIDLLGQLFGEAGFGPWTRVVVTTAESALFAAAIVTALALARRQLLRR